MLNPEIGGSGPAISRDIRAIVFDTFGTVVDWRGSLIASLARFGAQRSLNLPWDKVADRWRSMYKPKMELVRSGALEWTILDELHRLALIEIMPEFGIATLPEDNIRFLTECWHRLAPWPDAIPGLTRLRQKFIIGPLSNGNFSLMVNLAKYAQLPWDVIFGSDLFRHYKPDPETYLGVCSLLNLRPDQVMLGAAHNYDLAAARKLGLGTAFIFRANEHGPGQTTDLKPEQAWDVVATDFGDLANQLARRRLRPARGVG
ncbi:MAG: haloacid dehalogenase type II [Verrucomicrobia bacterium]|nr:haloacid dehalogenase type II [Verrucomicrobiota bacterium]